MKPKLFSSIAVATLTLGALSSSAQKLVKQSVFPHDFNQSSQIYTIENKNTTPKRTTSTRVASEDVIQYDSIYYYTKGATSWIPGGRIINIVYDGNNNKLSELEQTGGTGSWSNLSTREFSYDIDNNQTERLDKYWDGSAWQASYRWLYTYNSSNQLTNSLMQQYGSCGWTNFEKDDFTYDGNGNLKDDIFSLWHDSIFFTNSKKGYSYDSGNKLTKMVFYSWNYELSDWSKETRMVYQYEGNLNDVIFTENWNGASWVKSEKAKRNFDEDGNVTDENYFYLKDTTWIKSIHYIYGYDNHGNLKVLTAKNFINTPVYYEFRTRFFFHTVESLAARSMASANGPGDEIAVSVYPNPSAGIFKVALENKGQIKNIEVYDMLGVKVLDQVSSEISMETMAKGVYFVKVSDGGKIYKKKILIE